MEPGVVPRGRCQRGQMMRAAIINRCRYILCHISFIFVVCGIYVLERCQSEQMMPGAPNDQNYPQIIISINQPLTKSRSLAR